MRIHIQVFGNSNSVSFAHEIAKKKNWIRNEQEKKDSFITFGWQQ